MIKNLIKQTSWFMVSKDISKIVGIEASLMLSYLAEKEDFFNNQTMIFDGKKWFYLLSEIIENDTTLTYRTQKTCIKKLEQSGFIKTKLMGIPRKLYFHISEDEIAKNLNSLNNKRSSHSEQSESPINAENATIQMTKEQLIYKESNIKNQHKENNINNTICKSFKQFSFEEFESEVKQIASDNKIHPDHVSDFLDYWTEKDVTGKMGFQNQKTWETSKRLKRWVRSSKKQLPEYVWPGKSWDEMTFDERDKNKHIATPEQLKAHNSDNRNWF